jgi:hypothetical protein
MLKKIGFARRASGVCSRKQGIKKQRLCENHYFKIRSIFMKKLLIGLTLLASMSSFAMNSTEANSFASELFDNNKDVQERIIEYKNNLGNTSKKSDAKLISLKRDSGKENTVKEFLFSVRREVYDNRYLEQNSVVGYVYFKVAGKKVEKSKVILEDLEGIMKEVSSQKIFTNY